MNIRYSLLVSLLFLSCGPYVHIDYDREADFSTTTYQYMDAHTRRASLEPDPFDTGLNELDEKRIKRAIDSVFTNKKWIKTDYNQFYVRFYADPYYDDAQTNVGVGGGFGSGGGSIGVGVSVPIGPRMIHERLTIQVFGAYNDGALVWEGNAVGKRKEKATPAQKEVYYQKMIFKILQKFPPEKN